MFHKFCNVGRNRLAEQFCVQKHNEVRCFCPIIDWPANDSCHKHRHDALYGRSVAL